MKRIIVLVATIALVLSIVGCFDTKRTSTVQVEHLAVTDTLQAVDVLYVRFYGFNGEWSVKINGSRGDFGIRVEEEGKLFYEVMARATRTYVLAMAQCEKKEDSK